MKALVVKGKHKGKEIEISQWCNDWFTSNTGDWEIDRKPFSPTMLAFTMDDLEVIQNHNPGIMFRLFAVKIKNFGGKYMWTFRRRKWNELNGQE